MKNRLREFREKKGFSRERLAELADTSAGQIVKLENGERTFNLKWAERFSPFLDVTALDLLGLHIPGGVDAVPLSALRPGIAAALKGLASANLLSIDPDEVDALTAYISQVIHATGDIAGEAIEDMDEAAAMSAQVLLSQFKLR